MDEECNVCLDGGEGDLAEFSSTDTVKARKPHKCCECRQRQVGRRDAHQTDVSGLSRDSRRVFL